MSSLGKPVVEKVDMDDEMQAFAIEKAIDSLNSCFYEQVRTLPSLLTTV